MSRPSRIIASLAPLTLLIGCNAKSDQVTFALQADRFASSEWSEPVNLGPVINSSAVDANAGLSSDGHTLYFVSNRAGGVGNNDIWMSHRQCLACNWAAPLNLGPDVNTAANEQGSYYVHEPGEPNPFVYFNRPTAGGSLDIYRVAVSNDGDALGPAG